MFGTFGKKIGEKFGEILVTTFQQACSSIEAASLWALQH